ncbi:glucocorticoid-induced transcript 1 protein-like isoform X2 [Clavelina lepadiformis]|uniref:Uncharacterized protein n=1 Tax=Clavelina lepadiformis TaxID=159417 RepID=A0ABP0F6A9_CLALP
MMASKKTIPILKGGARMQPIRATQPFQLKKSPSSSPTPRSATETRNVRNRWSSSPDHRSSPDRVDRKSPNSPNIKVSNRRSPSPSIRRTASLDTIAGPYLTGQWPRDVIGIYQHGIHTRDNKATQTPDWSTETTNQQIQPIKSNNKSTHGRTSAIADPDFKQMREQIRRIAKSSRHNDKKERLPPVHGNHSALAHPLSSTQPRSMSNPISIGGQNFGRTPRRQNSMEALNKEIDMLINKDVPGNEPRVVQGITPPDGHRAPVPRSSTRTMETQTPQEFVREDGESASSVPTPTSSPSSEQQHLTHNSRNLGELEGKDAGVSPCPKYASSPRPNNTYMFKREPPEGAENVKPFKEQDTPQQISPTCPDKNKVNFYPKTNATAFTEVKTLHWKSLKPNHASSAIDSEQNNTTGVQTENNNSSSNEISFETSVDA